MANVGPNGGHYTIAVEAWQVVAQWDLQTDDQGTVHAVCYGTLETEPFSRCGLAGAWEASSIRLPSDTHTT